MGELTKEEMAHLDELRRNIAEQYTNGKWVLDATSWLPVIDRLVSKVERLEAETVEARSVVASMREHVLEATIAPNLKMFSAIKDGKVYALPPDKVRGFFEEIDARWKSPLVQKWSEEFRRARAVADFAQYEIPRLRARNEKLEAVAKAVDEGACVECENCGGDGHLGRSFESGKLVACEKCGGHEDSLGDGFVLSDDLRAALSALAEPGKGGGE